MTVDAFKRILRRRLEMTDGKANHDNTYIAIALLQVARDWVKVDDATCAELKRLKGRLPQMSFGMTRKNKLLITRFDESALKQRLLSAPDRMWQDMKDSSRNGRLQLAQAQAALAINILMYLPVRLGNLCILPVAVVLAAR